MNTKTKSAKTTTAQKKPTRGRPSLHITLPSVGKFTTATLRGRLAHIFEKKGKSVPTNVTLNNHIDRALKAGTIIEVGVKKPEGAGRPHIVYQNKEDAAKKAGK